MVAPLIRLDAELTRVQPGEQARVTVTITNPGTIIEGYRLEVLGPAAAWSQVVPAEVSVYTDRATTVTVVFSPPGGSAVPAGSYAFGLIARSMVNPNASAVAEGDIEVANLVRLQAKIVPVTSKGSRRGRHSVAISNGGNAWVSLQVAASDPDDLLGFEITPERLGVAPGTTETVSLVAVPRSRVLWGLSPTRLPFQVVAERLDAPRAPTPPGGGYGDPTRPVVDAAMSQRPVLSAWLLLPVILLVILAVVLANYINSRPPTIVPTLAPRSAPPKPKLKVTPLTESSVRLSWDAIDLTEGYDWQQVDQTGRDVGQEPQRVTNVTRRDVPELAPATRVCFQLRAVRGGVSGPWTDPSCATTLRPPPPPTPPATMPPVSAKPELRAATGTATIDGLTDDWSWTNPAAARVAIHKSPRASGTIYLMWDVDALYVLARVRDPSLQAPGPLDRSQIFHGDAVILELGAGSKTYPKEGLARPTDAYYMFGLGVPVPLIGVMGPNLAATSFDPPMRDASQITAIMVLAGDGSGYDLEAKIPWTATGLNDHAAGSVLAANFVISDRLTDSMKNRGMVSTNPQRTPELRAHPAYWQELQLLP